MDKLRAYCAAIFMGGALSVLSALTPAAGAVRCYDDWSTAGPVVRSEDLTPVKKILEIVRQYHDGKPLGVKLCETDGAFHYRVSIAEADGSVIWVFVDAKTGRVDRSEKP